MIQDEHLNVIKKENEDAVNKYKKDTWKNVMTQKIGLKRLKEVNARGNEANLMN
jgi:hypothetical protein